MRKSTVSIIIFTLILLSCYGCGRKGPAVCYVEGIVTFQNAPLDKANVSFVPVDPDSGTLFATGMTDAEGKFVLTATQGGASQKGTTPGEYRVVILRNKDTPKGYMPGMNADDKVPLYDSLIPDKYTDVQQTPLKAVVEKKKNVFDFPLKP